MQTIFDTQADFLAAGDVPIGVADRPTQIMSLNLISEEAEEVADEDPYSRTDATTLNSLKECIDLMYVCSQYMNVSVGPEKAQKLFEAVHENNMAKCIEGKLVKRDDGKILKPEGFDKNGWVPSFEEILNA